MKVLRSTLVAAVAVIAAACGDKVTVPAPVTTTAQIRSVTVSPAASTVGIGQAVNLSVAVVADSGLTYTVTWTASASNVTLSNQSNTGATATGATASPGVAVCAKATAPGGQTGQGCGSIVVSAAATTVAPTVSIASVNFTNGAGVQQPAPVPPAAVGTAAGIGPQLNVVMNVNAGTASLDSLVLRVGGKTAYKQAFSASEAAAILNNSNKDVAQSTPGITITGSFNTADYCAPANANGVTCTAANAGVATYPNGNTNFQALIFGKQAVQAGGNPGNTQGQSPVSTYRFANLDGFHVTMSFGNGVNTTPTAPASSDALVNATDQAGYKWVKGQPSISALFVAYTPALQAISSVSSTTATINALGCSGGGARTISLTNTSATSTIGPWTGTWTLNTTPLATLPPVTVNTYEWNASTIGTATPAPAGCGPAAGGAFVSGGDIVNMAAIGSDGNAIGMPAGVVPAGAGAAYGVGVLNTFASSNNPDPALTFRLDNVAPGSAANPLLVNMTAAGSTATTCVLGTGLAGADMGGRTNCWFNDAVQLAGLGRGTGNLWPGVWLAGGAQSSQTSSSGLILAGADQGSGRIIAGSSTVMSTTFQARADVNTQTNATIDAEANIATTSGLAESAANNTYQLRIRMTDLMGNTRQAGASGAGVVFQFGVDRTLPVLSLLAGAANGQRNYCTPQGAALPACAAGGVNYNLFPTDPSTLPAIGSGFFALGTSPLTVTQSVRNASGTFNWCGVGGVSPPAPLVGASGVYQTSGTPCTSGGTALGVAQAASAGTGNFRANLTYSDVHASALDGYYTATNTITDQAGNTSAVFTLIEVSDGTNSAWGGLSYSPAIITPGAGLTFSSTVGDNNDVQAVRLNLGVGTNGGAAPVWGTAPFDALTAAAFVPTSAAGGATFWQYLNGSDLLVNPCPAPTPQPAATCTTAPASLVTNTVINYPIASVFTNVQVSVAATGAGPFTYTVANNLMQATGYAFNQGVNIGVTPLNVGMASTVGISLGAVSPAIPALNGGGGVAPAAGGPANWVICAVSAAGSCLVAPAVAMTSPPATGAGTGLNGTFTISRTGAGGVPTNVNITAVAEGTTAVFQNPFSSVQFYAYDPTAGLGSEGWRLIGTLVSANSTSDLLAAVPNGRNWFFTINWTPNLTTAPDNAIYKVLAIGIANGTHTGPPSQVGAAVATPIAFSTVTVTP